MGNGRNLNGNRTSDSRGGHLRIYWEIMDSNAWRCLLNADKIVYLALQRQLRSTNNGDLSLPLSVSRQQGIKSPATLAKSLRALVAVGLIAVTRKGGCARGGEKLPTLYRFTDHIVYANPQKNIEAAKATNEWKSISTLGRGREAIRQAEEMAAKIQPQKMAHTASKNEVVGPKTASTNEVCTPLPSSNIEVGGKSKKSRKANSGAAFKKSTTFLELRQPTSNIEVLSTVAIHTGELGLSAVSPDQETDQFQVNHLSTQLH